MDEFKDLMIMKQCPQCGGEMHQEVSDLAHYYGMGNSFWCCSDCGKAVDCGVSVNLSAKPELSMREFNELLRSVCDESAQEVRSQLSGAFEKFCLAEGRSASCVTLYPHHHMDYLAGCHDCENQWDKADAQAQAVIHATITGHETWVEISLSISYTSQPREPK